MTFVEAALQAMGADDARRVNAESAALSAMVSGVAPGLSWAVDARREVALRHALLRAACGEVVGALGDEIPYLILKGEPLARMLYGDPSMRSSTDIDLLVLPGDYEEVRRRLLALGYIPRHAEGPRKWAYNQESLIHSGHGVEVEIHWQLAFPALPAMSPKALFETRQSVSLGDKLAVNVLRGDWMGIHLALHFHQHMGFAKGLLDMAAWCDRVAPSLDGPDFLEQTRRLGLFGVVQWPLHTLRLLCKARPPLYVEDVDRPVKFWAAVSANALRGCLAREFSGGLRDSFAALNPTVGPEIGVPLRALSMLVVDGGKAEKFGALLRPILQGPHFVGRAVRRWGGAR